MRRKEFGPWPWPECGLSIGDCFDQYNSEHKHRRKEWVYNITEALTQFLAVNNLDESVPVSVFNKDRFKIYKTMLLNGTAQAPHKRKPGPVTIARKLAALHHFVKWLVANDYLDRDVMAGVVLPSRMVANARTIKEAFTDDQLTLIFNALARYRNDRDPMRVEWYWLTLVLAHSGCRAMEVTQLHTADVRQDEGIWCMRITDDPAKRQRLKNKMSKRVVPIHSAVLKAGFLEWVERLPEGQLFPLLHPYGVQKSSGWMATLLKKLNLKKPSLTQHSLRHTVAVKMEKARVHWSVMRRLLGHAVGKSVEERVYLGSLVYSPKELQEAVEAISLPPIPL